MSTLISVYHEWIERLGQGVAMNGEYDFKSTTELKFHSAYSAVAGRGMVKTFRHRSILNKAGHCPDLWTKGTSFLDYFKGDPAWNWRCAWSLCLCRPQEDSTPGSVALGEPNPQAQAEFGR
jgi:hypothetical protein